LVVDGLDGELMSFQFGKWSFGGQPVNRKDLEPARALFARYSSGTNSNNNDKNDNNDKNNENQKEETCLFADSIAILYRGFHATRESKDERQPAVGASGIVVTWDGRLDNRQELLHALGRQLPGEPPDVTIVTSAYDKWGTDCLERLIGDWALSVWVPWQRALILAKDFLGVRPLYYRIDRDQALWSTLLEPLIASSGHPETGEAEPEVELNEEYIAGWFSMFPAAHLTPYRGIHSVEPASYVMVRPNQVTTREYWKFDGGKSIRYRTDKEYEEHFRTLFAQSVKRRLRSDRPIVAELSGGMDSSSIVAMADHVLAQDESAGVRVETVSYYDDSEPNWNERPYFTRVEQQRGRIGCHINAGLRPSLSLAATSDQFPSSPAAQGNSFVGSQLAAYMRSLGSCVLLSGIGGDEVTGGVPTAAPELADLAARARLGGLAHQLKVWALKQRRPWFHLLFEMLREFLPLPHLWVPEYRRPSPWLDPGFVRRNRDAAYGYPTRLKLFGPLPSFQENIATLHFMRRHLASAGLSSEPHYEKRYPYLDRDLLEFLYAVPREQMVRPGQRRSLMRRALVGIVPEEILNRKRKAYVARRPSLEITTDWKDFRRKRPQLTSGLLGMVNAEELACALEQVRHGQDAHIVPLFRTLLIEIWLSQLRDHKISRLAARDAA
jgi:asparagine synthase (glutamine-hydrolysing)